MEAKELIKALRTALGLSHDDVASRSKGKLHRQDMVRLENGEREPSTARLQDGLKNAFGLTRDQLAQYLDGDLSLDEATAIARSKTEAGEHGGDDMTPRAVGDTPLEHAVIMAFDPSRHTAADLDAARAAARVAANWIDEHTDVGEMGRRHLDAAAWLRKRGTQATVQAVGFRVVELGMRAPAAHVAELSTADNAQGALEAERLDHPERFDAKTGERIAERDTKPENAPKPKRKTK